MGDSPVVDPSCDGNDASIGGFRARQQASVKLDKGECRSPDKMQARDDIILGGIARSGGWQRERCGHSCFGWRVSLASSMQILVMLHCHEVIDSSRLKRRSMN